MFDAPQQFDDQGDLVAGRETRRDLLSSSFSLADAPRGAPATVVGVLAPALEEERELVVRLIEIGFVPGESVRVVAFGSPGHDPLAVRLGATTFALRRFEAEYVRVVIDPAV